MCIETFTIYACEHVTNQLIIKCDSLREAERLIEEEGLEEADERVQNLLRQCEEDAISMGRIEYIDDDGECGSCRERRREMEEAEYEGM